MPASARPLGLFLLLGAAVSLAGAGCDFYAEDPADDDSVAGDDDAAASCDEQVYLPANTVDPAPEGLADPHQEVYGDDPAPFQVRYQWPSRDPSRSAAFLWRTGVDTLASAVEWGVGDALDQRAEGYTFTFATTDSDPGYRVHEVRLCDRLEPGTTYSYRVGGAGSWSPTYQFTTPGAPGTFDTFRVAISGDSRGDYATWGALVQAMEAHAPDFYLFDGDMVDFGTSQGEWDAWFEASGDVLARKMLVPTHGNHEFLAANYFAQFALPGIEEWFSVDYGTLHVVSLNDTTRGIDVISTTELSFLQKDLASTTLPWRVALHHQPAYSTCTTHGSNEEVQQAWVPVFEQYDVDLVVAGHNHIYERSVPIRAGAEVSPGGGPTYLVSGGAGADLYPNTEELWFGAVADPVEHYVIADFSPSEVHLTAYDLSGTVIDQFTLPAN